MKRLLGTIAGSPAAEAEHSRIRLLKRAARFRRTSGHGKSQGSTCGLSMRLQHRRAAFGASRALLLNMTWRLELGRKTSARISLSMTFVGPATWP
jgi:hypothetical protein